MSIFISHKNTDQISLLPFNKKHKL